MPSSQTQEEEEGRNDLVQNRKDANGAERDDAVMPEEKGTDGEATMISGKTIDWARVTHVVTESMDWASERSAIEAAGRSFEEVHWVIVSPFASEMHRT